MAINCDLVLASSGAEFGLPEVQRGVVAMAGALPRLARVVGRQRAMEMGLVGGRVSAEGGRGWGFVNCVVGDDGGDDDDGGKGKGKGKGGVVGEAVRWAERIAGNSPDSVVVSKQGVEMGWEEGSVEVGTERLRREWYGRMEGGENMREGVRAFVEKRGPRWVDSKL